MSSTVPPTPDSPPAAPQAGESGTSPPSVSPAEIQLHELDPRYVPMERWQRALTAVVLGPVLLVGGFWLRNVIPFPWVLTIPLVWILFVGFTVVNTLYWPRWYRERFGYRLDQEVFELRRGVVWRVSVTIPLARIQHVDLHHGPWESRFGLATLEIHTAGTHHATQQIPGLTTEVAKSLRDDLIAAVQRVQHGT